MQSRQELVKCNFNKDYCMARINFDLQELQAFVAVSEKLSFRGAADELNISAPALSRRIEKLQFRSAAPSQTIDNLPIRLIPLRQFIMRNKRDILARN